MNKWYIFGGSFAVVFLAMVISGPKVAENLRPLKNDRMQEGFGVYTDKDSGKIYGFIEGAGGEKRFVQMEKNSENKVRKERLEAEAKAAKAAAKKARELAEAAGEYIAPIKPVAVSKSKLDVRSGEIFSKDAEFEGFLVNSRVKWRTRERKMLYRLSITAPSTIYTNDSKEPNCISSDKESELISLVTGKDNDCLLYTSPSPRDRTRSRMPSSA